MKARLAPRAPFSGMWRLDRAVHITASSSAAIAAETEADPADALLLRIDFVPTTSVIPGALA
jgi:hypothetical protein